MSFTSRRSFAPVVVAVVAAIVGLVVAACDDNNGVNDVKAACEVRAKWKRLTSDTCVNCIAAAPSPPCDCPTFTEFGGKCETQGNARRDEPSCASSIDQCTYDCKNDCACIDRCYANAEACKKVTAARDGCVADVCAPHCD